MAIINKSLNYLPDSFFFLKFCKKRFVAFFFELVCWAFCPEVSLVCLFIHGFSGFF